MDGIYVVSQMAQQQRTGWVEACGIVARRQGWCGGNSLRKCPKLSSRLVPSHPGRGEGGKNRQACHSMAKVPFSSGVLNSCLGMPSLPEWGKGRTHACVPCMHVVVFQRELEKKKSQKTGSQGDPEPRTMERSRQKRRELNFYCKGILKDRPSPLFSSQGKHAPLPILFLESPPPSYQ